MRERVLTVGSLFSGIGGFDLGLEWAGFNIAWQVETNAYCRAVLGKHWPTIPCHDDIKTVDWRDIPTVDLVCAGFPCQPFSVAGKQKGKDDDRYLWPEVVRCLAALRPTWFLGENVPGIISLALDQVCADLESLGYTVWPVCLPACAVDAPHIRQRVWIVAYTDCCRLNGQSLSIRSGRQNKNASIARGTGKDVADASCKLLNGGRGSRETSRGKSANSGGWAPEPAVGRVDHGIPRRVDRLRGLGNAIVPQVAEAIGKMILKAHVSGDVKTVQGGVDSDTQ